MEMFSLIKQSLVSDTSNPISKNFKIGKQVASGGHMMVWKVHDGVRIKDKQVSGDQTLQVRCFRDV